MMARVPPGNTLQPTALVHEAFIRLSGDDPKLWDSRAHFFGSAAIAMRQILVDQARRKSALKRGGDRTRVDASDVNLATAIPEDDVLGLNRALQVLERHDPRAGRVVMLRYFVGLSIEECAETLSVSVSTVERDWKHARAFLRKLMDDDPGDGPEQTP
jgi:RNA polymerase sigma factor (TIGR02999 family)